MARKISLRTSGAASQGLLAGLNIGKTGTKDTTSSALRSMISMMAQQKMMEKFLIGLASKEKHEQDVLGQREQELLKKQRTDAVSAQLKNYPQQNKAFEDFISGVGGQIRNDPNFAKMDPKEQTKTLLSEFMYNAKKQDLDMTKIAEFKAIKVQEAMSSYDWDTQTADKINMDTTAQFSNDYQRRENKPLEKIKEQPLSNFIAKGLDLISKIPVGKQDTTGGQ
jgi:hypothetical protein